jgi:hypothetical protein
VVLVDLFLCQSRRKTMASDFLTFGKFRGYRILRVEGPMMMAVGWPSSSYRKKRNQPSCMIIVMILNKSMANT